MQENKGNDHEENMPRQGGVNWQPAVEIFTQVSGWIVAPIVIALVVGKKLDSHFGTEPKIFLALAGLGFIFTCIGIVRVVRSYTKKLKEIEKEK